MAVLPLHRFRLTIGQYMVAVAMCAAACTWPERFATAVIMGLSGFLTLHLLLSESKVIHRMVRMVVVLAIVAVMIALWQPAVAIR